MQEFNHGSLYTCFIGKQMMSYYGNFTEVICKYIEQPWLE